MLRPRENGQGQDEPRATSRPLGEHPHALPYDSKGVFDGFNEDLTWILNKLVARTGGSTGVISGQVSSECRPTLLASVLNDPTERQLATELNHRAAGIPVPPDCSDPDNPRLLHSLMTLHELDGTTRRYRVLQLAFSPAPGVRMVATVAKASRLGFNFLEDANARRLYPVLSRYIRLWWLHRVERRRGLALRAVIDLSDLGIILLNHKAHLLFANSRGGALVAKHDGLVQEGRKITTAARSDQEPFCMAVSRALHTNQTAGDPENEAREPIVLQIGRNNDKRDLILAVKALQSPAVDPEDPAVIVYALDPDLDTAELLAPVCAIYRLTAAEARLAGQLVGGYSVTEAAERINIRPQTARAYLKSIFTKTKTHRQAELVRLMLSSTLRTSAARGLT